VLVDAGGAVVATSGEEEGAEAEGEHEEAELDACFAVFFVKFHVSGLSFWLGVGVCVLL
jgi:hypothetical protein